MGVGGWGWGREMDYIFDHPWVKRTILCVHTCDNDDDDDEGDYNDRDSGNATAAAASFDDDNYKNVFKIMCEGDGLWRNRMLKTATLRI